MPWILTALSQMETLYKRVLQFAEEQERRLLAGELEKLQTLLLHKEGAVAKAQACLGRVGLLLGRAVAAEEHCRAIAPVRTPTPPRAQVAAAYGHFAS